MDAESKSNGHGPAAIKVFLVCMPVSIVVYELHVKNHVIIGLSLVAGVLLQALVPPRKRGLLPLLAGTVIYTVIYALLRR
jgi:hypothetical protein